MLKSRFFTPFATVVALAVAIPATPVSSAEDTERRETADSLAGAYARADRDPVFDPGGGLDHYLAWAAAHSPAVRAAFHEWVAAEEKTGYAGALPDPRFVYTYFIENVETRVGPQIQRFGIQQVVPWFGTLGARRDESLEAAGAAYRRFEARRLRLAYEVKAAFYEYYYLGREIAITRENLELLVFWEDTARARYRVALTPHPDVIKAQLELGRLEDRLRTVEARRAPVEARLRAVLSLPDSVRLPAPAAIEVEETAIDRDAVIAAVRAQNPDLKSLRHNVERTRAAVRLAGKSSYPDLVIGLDYIDTGDAIDRSTPESGKDAVTATVGVSLPIWFGANKARKQEAEARRRSAGYHYTDAVNRLTAAADQKVFEYEDALRKTRLYRDGLVPRAQQSLNATFTAYQADETDFLDLLDAQRQLLDLQLRFERSVSDLAIRRAELEKITGTNLARLVSKEPSP